MHLLRGKEKPERVTEIPSCDPNTDVFIHHVGTAGRALSSRHELGLTFPPKTVAPQSLADILEQHERNRIIRILLTAAGNKAHNWKNI